MATACEEEEVGRAAAGGGEGSTAAVRGRAALLV